MHGAQKVGTGDRSGEECGCEGSVVVQNAIGAQRLSRAGSVASLPRPLPDAGCAVGCVHR